MKSSLPSVLVLVVVASACGGSEEDGSPIINGLDTSQAGVIAFVKERRYQGWLAEPTVHASRGPHGKVRVFFNSEAVQSLSAGNDTHPVGTILVKELYSNDGAELRGHALDVKVKAGSGKDTWLFFEGDLPDYSNALYGRGHDVCHGCHEAGTDYVTTPLPR